MKVLFIVGSLRKGSLNRQLSNVAKELIQDKVQVDYLDYSDVPFINIDNEFPVPEAVQKLRDTVKSYDGVWLFSPEYNWSYPGHVKNLFDWLSRPVEPGSMETVAKGLKITISNVAGGFGGGNCREKFFQLSKRLQMKLMEEPVVGVKNTGAQLAKAELELKDEDRATLEAQAKAFLEFIEAE